MGELYLTIIDVRAAKSVPWANGGSISQNENLTFSKSLSSLESILLLGPHQVASKYVCTYIPYDYVLPVLLLLNLFINKVALPCLALPPLC